MHLLVDVAPSISALPANWKLSNVVPISKEPGKQDVHLFRPMSLLLVISKTVLIVQLLQTSLNSYSNINIQSPNTLQPPFLF